MVRIVHFVDEGLGHSSYLIDLGDGSAALIDPPRFPTAHETLASRDGLRLVWTADTHSHADYVTGSPGLTARLGATFLAPDASQLDSPHEAVTDGQRVDLGNGCRLIPVATPGHTPDHHSYLLEHDGEVIGLFSGGSLMVGAVGRTDLAGPDLAERRCVCGSGSRLPSAPSVSSTSRSRNPSRPSSCSASRYRHTCRGLLLAGSRRTAPTMAGPLHPPADLQLPLAPHSDEKSQFDGL